MELNCVTEDVTGIAYKEHTEKELRHTVVEDVESLGNRYLTSSDCINGAPEKMKVLRERSFNGLS